MSLTDLMSGAGLSGYAVVALILFFGSFLALVGWVWWPAHKAWWQEAAQLPLDETSITPTTTTSTTEPR
jgi:cbb3-type cytochrome oxidase subunit 3